MVKKEVLRIEIPEFITHVKLSNKRRAKYYTKGKKIPTKYTTSEYTYNKEGILIHKVTRLPIISNPRSVGTPRIKKINGQDIYRGNNDPHVRSKMVSSMKEFFSNEVRKRKVQPIPLDHYPLEMELEMHLPNAGEAFDIDNAGWLYVKVIQDVLTTTRVIRNDVAILLPKSGGVQYVPLDEGEQRKLVILLRENDTPYREKFKTFIKQEEKTF